TVMPAPAVKLPPAGVVSVGAGAAITGVPPVVHTVAGTDSAALRTLAGVTITALGALADRVESGALALAPAARGAACDVAAPANWGAPLGAGHPCGGYAPLIFAPGDLTVVSGEGQGVLLVAGDFVLDSAATFAGGVVVLGDADIAGSIVGGLRVAGRTRIDGQLRHDPCALWRAVVRSPALGRPFRPRRWRLAVP
ncbi:MAG: hypothetical protein ACRELX_16585, partial [Longimicrobiales bacterium]